MNKYIQNIKQKLAAIQPNYDEVLKEMQVLDKVIDGASSIETVMNFFIERGAEFRQFKQPWGKYVNMKIDYQDDCLLDLEATAFRTSGSPVGAFKWNMHHVSLLVLGRCLGGEVNAPSIHIHPLLEGELGILGKTIIEKIENLTKLSASQKYLNSICEYESEDVEVELQEQKREYGDSIYYLDSDYDSYNPSEVKLID